MVAPASEKSKIPDLERLRWLAVWLPVAGIGLVLGVVAILMLQPYLGWPVSIGAYLLTMSVLAGGAYLFSHFIFRVIHQKELEILRRNQELAALNAVGTVVAESLDLDEVLNGALEKVLEVTGADAGEIFLWDESEKALVQRAFRGVHPEAFREVTRFNLSEGFPGLIAEEGKAIAIEDLSPDPRLLRGKVKAAGFQSFAGVPLKAKGKVVGVMDIASLAAGHLSAEDVKLLGLLGNQIGISIENARLYAQLREMTTLEERQRLAREMHDGLAQNLGYIHLKISQMKGAISSVQRASIRKELGHLGDVVGKAYEEVRQAIFGLRVMVSRGLGLIPTLAEYLHDFSQQTGIAVEFQVSEDDAPRVSPQAEVQLVRIIQESLANVRKHARATQAWVILRKQQDQAVVIIRDVGIGFRPEALDGGDGTSFGLQAMRERAESVRGSFELRSSPGKGTEVIIRLPLASREVMSWRS